MKSQNLSLPTRLLQISLRQYAEPALGLKSKFVSSLSRINHDAIESIASSEWIVLLYAMSFLHSWILARGEWALHGWCLPHEFHSNDLLQGFRFMKAVFEDPQNMLPGMSKTDIPWETVQKMCSDILFGSAIEHTCSTFVGSSLCPTSQCSSFSRSVGPPSETQPKPFTKRLWS